MIETPGEKFQIAKAAVDVGSFRHRPLRKNTHIEINSGQFLRSLANTMQSRMFTISSRIGQNSIIAKANSAEYHQLLTEISILDQKTWPSDYESIPSFGEDQMRNLCARFRIDANSANALVGFKVMKASSGRFDDHEGLAILKEAVSCIPISTAKCERAFSVMNTIMTPTRNRL